MPSPASALVPLLARGNSEFRDGFEPLLPGCEAVPFEASTRWSAPSGSERGGGRRRRARAGGGGGGGGRRGRAVRWRPLWAGTRAGQGRQPASRRAIWRAHSGCARPRARCSCADEVQTGLRRTGRFPGARPAGLQPDMVCVAKALLHGGLVPIGALLVSRELPSIISSMAWAGRACGSTASAAAILARRPPAGDPGGARERRSWWAAHSETEAAAARN